MTGAETGLKIIKEIIGRKVGSQLISNNSLQNFREKGKGGYRSVISQNQWIASRFLEEGFNDSRFIRSGDTPLSEGGVQDGKKRATKTWKKFLTEVRGDGIKRTGCGLGGSNQRGQGFR